MERLARLRAVVACAWLGVSAGCGGGSPAVTPDASTVDAPTVSDAPVDAPAELDAPMDAPIDAPAVMDAPTTTDAPAVTDAPRDVPRDAPRDVPRDVPRDGPPPVDLDGDGYDSDVDCDDRNAHVHPDAVDLCSDGIDQDCNGRDNVCTCTRRLHVLVDDYGTVNGRSLEDRSNGCWEVHSVNDRVPMEFRHCIHGTNTSYACDGHVRQLFGDDWYYDDTHRDHGDDAARIRQCATRCGMSPTAVGTGFVTMAATGGWLYEDGGLTGVRFFAQLYTSTDESLQAALVTSWRNDRRAAPMVSLTRATAAQIASWTATVCAPLTAGNWIGYYVGSGRGAASGLGALAADDYMAWGRALNTCTR